MIKTMETVGLGGPLIVEEHGTDYYVKELARSEGYELSSMAEPMSSQTAEITMKGVSHG